MTCNSSPSSWALAQGPWVHDAGAPGNVGSLSPTGSYAYPKARAMATRPLLKASDEVRGGLRASGFGLLKTVSTQRAADHLLCQRFVTAEV
jgi:hypothetical protein